MSQYEVNWNPEDPITLETLSAFLNAFFERVGQEHAVWSHLRKSIRQYCLSLLNDPESKIQRLEDIGPLIWAFYNGYMVYHNEVDQRLKV